MSNSRATKSGNVIRYTSFIGIDINALNLYGESALSTATYNNQLLCVEYLLTNRSDPKLYALLISVLIESIFFF